MTEQVKEEPNKLKGQWSDTREVLQSEILAPLHLLKVNQRGVEECEMHWLVIVEELTKFHATTTANSEHDQQHHLFKCLI